MEKEGGKKRGETREPLEENGRIGNQEERVRVYKEKAPSQ